MTRLLFVLIGLLLTSTAAFAKADPAPVQVGGTTTQFVAMDGTGITVLDTVVESADGAPIFGLLPSRLEVKDTSVGLFDVGSFTTADRTIHSTETNLFYPLGPSDSYFLVGTQVLDWPTNLSAVGVGYRLPLTWNDANGIEQKPSYVAFEIAEGRRLRITAEGHYPLKRLLEGFKLLGGSSDDNYMLYGSFVYFPSFPQRDASLTVRHPFNGEDTYLEAGWKNIGSNNYLIAGVGVTF